jgi:hypothetical protein
MGRSAQIRRRRVLPLSGFAAPAEFAPMSLRGEPQEQEVKLPDGRVVNVRVGVAEDSYIPRRELDTVTLELYDESRGEHLAGISTVLDVEDVSAARALLREVVAGLGDGSLEPTAGALEPLADSVPEQ